MTVILYKSHFQYKYMNQFQQCDVRRREKVGALYSVVSGSLAIISRACTLNFSPVPQNI